MTGPLAFLYFLIVGVWWACCAAEHDSGGNVQGIIFRSLFWPVDFVRIIWRSFRAWCRA